MEQKCICKSCTETKNLTRCEVCDRPICNTCIDKNNQKYNVNFKTKKKPICDYCAEIYWRGF